MDVAIAGGGLIGLASALELASRGLRVLVVEPGEPGQASWAAAGILGPQSEAHEPSPLVELCVKSYELYPRFVQTLQADVGFRQNGTLHLAFTESEAQALEQRRAWQAAKACGSRSAGTRARERRSSSPTKPGRQPQAPPGAAQGVRARGRLLRAACRDFPR